jgi:hypothetical protein
MKNYPLIFIFTVVLCFFFSCGDGSDDPEHDFIRISGSGYITLNIIGGVSGLPAGDLIITASGITFGQVERVVTVINSADITSDDISIVLNDGSEPFLFTGGDIIPYITILIEVGGTYGWPDSGDYMVELENIHIDGDVVIPICPGDFNIITGSNLIFIDKNGISGYQYICTTTGLLYYNDERYKYDALDDIRLPLTIGGSFFCDNFKFPNINFVIDQNNNSIFDEFDYYAYIEDYTYSLPGNVDFIYPEDFTQITGFSTITINLKGAYEEHAGEMVLYGCSGIPYGDAERMGGITYIDSNDMILTIQDMGEHFMFADGIEIGGVGLVINTNGNNWTDNGDWIAMEKNVTINGDTVIEFNY